MKKTVASFLAAAAVLAAGPAFAQATGTVAVSGTVTAKCAAVTPIGDTIALGELATADGTIDKTFSKASNGLTRNFTVRCNGANPKLSVEARPLVNAAAVNSPNGYTNTVHYTATLVAKGASGSTKAVTDASNASGATTTPLGDRLAASADNVSLTIQDGTTTAQGAILEAGSYSGTVDLIISPAA